MEVIVVLDDVRSAHNVGSIFRTADGAGVAKIILAGYTPRPIDRFGRPQPEIAKTALGAAEVVPYEAADDSEAVIRRLKHEGWYVVAVEQAPGSTTLSEFTAPARVVFVFGNEVTGVSSEVLAAADEIVELPMRGAKESLNVGVTVGVLLYYASYHQRH